MRYNEVCNELFMRRRMTPPNVWINDVFTNRELDIIENYCDNKELNDAKIVTDEYVNQVRISKIAFISKDQTTEWMFARFNNLINRINVGYYGFDLYGYESIQYTTYDKDGKFEWHTDLLYGDQLGNTVNNDTRKLTLVMLLNDNFTGGELMISTGSEDKASYVEMKRGTVVAFPSFVPHKVKPVTSGLRKSLVIWVEGPKFR